MGSLVVDIGSNVVRCIDAGNYVEQFKIEHQLGKVLAEHDQDPQAVLEGKHFTRVVDKIIHPLNRYHKKFGIDALFVVATGAFQEFNQEHPGEFSCAVYARSTLKGDVPIFPLIWRDDIQNNPQTRYAMAMENALLCSKSKSSEAIRGISANIIAVRGSGISAIRVDEPIQIGTTSMPHEYRYDIKVSGADKLPKRKSFEEIVDYYRTQVNSADLKLRLREPITILIGKGARDLIEYKEGIKLDNSKHYLSVSKITIKPEDVIRFYDSIQKQLGKKIDSPSERKKLIRMRNTLGFIQAIFDCSVTESVLLSDAKFSNGLAAPLNYGTTSFKDSMARFGVLPFSETFLVGSNLPESAEHHLNLPNVGPRVERFVSEVIRQIELTQEKLDINYNTLDAINLFNANSYPYLPEHIQQIITAAWQEKHQ